MAVPTQIGAPQESVPCDVETVKKIPDELREPQGEVLPEPQPLAPRPLLIKSLPVAVPCIDHDTYGDTVTFPEGQKTQNLYFSAILSIKEDVLTYIAKNHLETEIEVRLNAHTITAKQLNSMTGMRNSEAEELIEQANYIQEQLTAAVRAQAEGLLHCYWENNVVVHAECPDPEMAHPEDAADAVFSVDINAGTYQSYISQQDANTKAQAAAEAMLNCFYLNDEFIAKCEERPNRPMDDMEPVPNDEEPIYPGRNLRVGTVVVPAKKFRSTLSKEDANRKAQEWGYAQLVCWYPNLIVDAQCDDPNARDIQVDPAKEPAHDADIHKKKVGQHVYVPYGFFTSDLSTELATQEAEAFAESLLQCCFINKPIDLVCEAQEVFLADGTKGTIYPEEQYSPMMEVHVAAGEYTSCVSQEEADHFAQLMVEGMLSCRYCNLPVPPSCVPSWVLEGVKNGTIDIPLVDGEIKDENHPDGVSPASFPLNATRGTPRCTILTPDAQVSQEMAELLGALPVTGEEGEMCTYYNDEIIVACAAEDPYQGSVIENIDGEGYWAVQPETGKTYYFYSMYPPHTCLYTRMTIPLPGEYVRVKVGMFAAQGADQKDIVNQRAIVYAMSMLQCWFANPKTEAYCNSGEYAESLCDTAWSFGDPSLIGGPPELLQDWSNTPLRPVVVPEGQIVVTGMTPESAYSYIYTYTRALILAQIMCVYGNVEVTRDCTNNFQYHGALLGGKKVCADQRSEITHVHPGSSALTVPAKIFTAYTAENAQALADSILFNINFCSSDDYVVYYECPENPNYNEIPDFEAPDYPHPPQWNPQFPQIPSSSSWWFSSSEPWTSPEECTLCFDVTFTADGEPEINNVTICETGESAGSGFAIAGGGGTYEEGDEVTITIEMDPTEPSGCEGCYAHCTGTWTGTAHLGTAGGAAYYGSDGSASLGAEGSGDTSNTSNTSNGEGSSGGGSSGGAGSSGSGCYQECPNYIKAQTILLTQSPELFHTLTRDFTLWENDVAYIYEELTDELRKLEQQLRELMAQL